MSDLDDIIKGLVQDTAYEINTGEQGSTQPTTPQLNDTWLQYYMSHNKPQSTPVQSPVAPKWGAQNTTRPKGQPRIPWGNPNRGDNR